MFHVHYKKYWTGLAVTSFVAFARVGAFGHGEPYYLQDTKQVEWNKVKTYNLGICTLMVAKHRSEAVPWFQDGIYIDSIPRTILQTKREVFFLPTEIRRTNKDGKVILTYH